MKNIYKSIKIWISLFSVLFAGNIYGQDAGVTQILNPVNYSCGSKTQAIQIIIYNYGSSTISNIPVKLSATGTSSFSLTDTLKKNIASGKQDTLTFKTTINTYSGGNWKFAIWTNLSGDVYHSNDSLIIAIKVNAVPNTPTGSATSSCGAGNVSFTASSTTKGSTIYWFTSDTSITPIASGDTLTEKLSATQTLYAACSSGTGFDSLSTTFSSTAIKDKGAMFDVRALHDLTVDSFDVSFITKVNDTVYVYYKLGSYAGYQTKASAWTFAGKAYVTPSAANSPASAKIGGINLKAGNVYGIYVCLPSKSISVKTSFLAVTKTSDSAYNSDLTISSGDELTGNFSGNTNGYLWDGRVYYSAQGCLSPKVAITGTVKTIVQGLNLSKDINSGGALNKGSLSNPDQVCLNDSLKYDIGVPTNFSNSEYGTKWKLKISLKTVHGNTSSNYTISYPTGTSYGVINLKPLKSDVDSVYVLTLIATNLATGCDTTITRYINIDGVVVPGFSVSNVCLGHVVSPFNSATPAGKLSFLWSYGNGDTTFGANQAYFYKNPGTYTITQIAFNPGCGATISKSITIYNSPFGSAITKGVTFLGQFNRGTILNPDYLCLGDSNIYYIVPPKGLSNSDYGKKWAITGISLKTLSGSPAYSKDTATMFPISGKNGSFRFSPTKYGDSLYEIRISIETMPGNCDSVIDRYVQVMTKPSTDFTFTNNCLGTPINFKDASTTPFFTKVSTWIWDYSDGVIDSVKNTDHAFQKAGSYSVKLTAVTESGCAASKSQIVQQYPIPNIRFGYIAACNRFLSKFIDSSGILSGTIKTWSWNFGDGSGVSMQNPNHIYSIPGNYVITLSETSNLGCSDTLTKNIRILPSPVAGFTFKNACVGTAIYTANNSVDSTGKPAYSWNFGDGSKSNLTGPSHIYNSNGTYPVSLVTISQNGCSDTSKQNITPHPKPIVNIGYQNACAGQPALMADTGTIGSGYTYSWNYGDNDSYVSNIDSTNHIYKNAGTYHVTLSVQSAEGCFDSSKADISVAEIPMADFKPSDVCLNKQPAVFTNSSTGSGTLSYNWDAGDNSKITTTTNLNHTYSADGKYLVRLITLNASGCADTISKLINIYPVPVINAWKRNQNVNVVTFIPADTSIGTFKWYFGDPGNDSSSIKKPTFTYPTGDGKYEVKLFVTNTSGCTSVKTDSVYTGKYNGIAEPVESPEGITIYPNPFDGIAHICYSLKSRSDVNVTVYDLSGKQIVILKNGSFESGSYMDVFDASKYQCSAGLYILKMKVNDRIYSARIEKIK